MASEPEIDPAAATAALGTLDTARPDSALDRTAPAPAPGANGHVLGAGFRIGRLVVTRALGSGAMGVVYAARDPELDRAVAVKLLLKSTFAGDDGMVARLRREARALAQLAHPNVVAIHDVGTHEGAPYLAMEHVHGVTLRAWLDKQSRSWREVVHVFAQAARGLAAAHDAGLVHRDFKPENVMVGDDGRVRVMDFGLARAEETVELAGPRPTGALDELMTASGAFMETPAYMAPEQFAGTPGDARSDQYNFAASMYEALVGVRPFAGRTLAELADAVMHGPAPPRRVPRALRALVMRGLSRVPAERHADMTQVATELERIVRRSTRSLVAGGAFAAAAVGATAFVLFSRAHEPSTCERSARRIDQHWNAAARTRLATQLAGSTATVAAALDEYAGRWRVLARETCDAKGSLQAAIVEQREVCLDNRLRTVSALLDVWSSAAPGVAAAAPGAVFALPSIADCANQTALTVAPALTKEQNAAIDRMRSRIAGGSARLASGLTEDSLAELRGVATEADKLGVESFAAEAALALGSATFDSGLAIEARETLERARLHAERAHDPTGIAEALVRSVPAATGQGKLDDAVALSERAKKALEDAGHPDRLELMLERALAHLHMLRGDIDTAAKEVADAHTRTDALFGVDSAEAAEIERLEGSLAVFQNDHPGARKRMEHAIERLTRLHGSRDPAIARIHTQLCGLDTSAQAALARPHCDLARAYYESAGAAQRASLARVLWMSSPLAPTPAERIAMLARARATVQDTAGGDNLEAAAISAEIASVYFDERQFAQAAAAIEAQIGTLERALGKQHPRVAKRYNALGRSWLLADKPDRAQGAFEHALALQEADSAASPDELMESLIELGNLHTKLNDGRAMHFYDRAIALTSGGALADPTGKRLGSALLLVANELQSRGEATAALHYYGRAVITKDPQTRMYALAGRANAYSVIADARHADEDLAAARKIPRAASDTLFIEASACSIYLHLERYKLAANTCGRIAATQPAGSALRAILDGYLAEAELGLGHIAKARTMLEGLAAQDLGALGAPPDYRGEVMFVLARARRAAGDEAGATTAADEAERELVAHGPTGGYTLPRLRRWREGKPMSDPPHASDTRTPRHR